MSHEEIMHWDEFSEEEKRRITQPLTYPNEKKRIQRELLPHLQHQMRYWCARWQWLNNEESEAK